ncbi:MAG: hypothetical protein QOF12_230 [Solirubrobacteraceae bacterium]|nr:hypothetical protein [Solirubrobacteraceae bacterium]
MGLRGAIGLRTALLAPALALTACGTAAGGPDAATTAARPAPRPRPIVLLVPGSGFRGSGEHGDSTLSIPTRTWRRWGFRTAVAAYRPGAAGLRDVTNTLRAVAGAAPTAPLCVYGESSGGTWALVAAADFKAVSCVVVAAAPTDQETWAHSRRHAAHVFAHTVWPGYFGPPPRDNAFEPYDVWKAARPAIPVFAIYAVGDPIVPAQQGQLFTRLVPGSTLRVLRPGAHPFVHSHVSAGDYVRAVAEVRRFVLGRVRETG